MADIDLSELEIKLKVLLEKKDAIRRKILEYSIPLAPDVQSAADLKPHKPHFHIVKKDKLDELEKQLTEINLKIHDFETEIKMRKEGIY